MLEKEITKAFVYSYQEQAETLFQNYLDHAEAYVNKTRVKDRNTARRLQPDEGFLKSVEEQIAIIGSAADGFRQEVIAYLWAATRRGRRSTTAVRAAQGGDREEADEFGARHQPVITKARTRDEEQIDKYNTMVKNLLDHGYCENCVDMVLKYAANNLWKDKHRYGLSPWRTSTGSTMATIFRPYSSSDSHAPTVALVTAASSPESAGVDPREHRRYDRRRIHHRQRQRPNHQGADSRRQGIPLHLR